MSFNYLKWQLQLAEAIGGIEEVLGRARCSGDSGEESEWRRTNGQGLVQELVGAAK